MKHTTVTCIWMVNNKMQESLVHMAIVYMDAVVVNNIKWQFMEVTRWVYSTWSFIAYAHM